MGGATIAEDQQNLQDLFVKRSSVRGQITKFKNYVFQLSSKSTLTTTDDTRVNFSKQNSYKVLPCQRMPSSGRDSGALLFHCSATEYTIQKTRIVTSSTFLFSSTSRSYTFGAFPVLCYGTAVGWMSPMTLLLQSDQSPTGTPLSDNVVSWMASSACLCCMPATFLSAYIEDRFGRKIAVLAMSVSMLTCWAIKLISMEVWAFIAARTAMGFAMGGAFVVSPVYVKEISEDSIRGALGSLTVLSQTVGNLLLFIIGDYMSYRGVLWFCLSLPAAHLVIFGLFMPESPSYLVKKGKTEEAAKVLAWLRCRNIDDRAVQIELDVIRKEQENDQESNKFAGKEIFTNTILFRAFRIAMAVTLARELCGAIPVLNFAGYIFELSRSGLVLSPNQQAMMLGAIQVAGSILASSVVEKAGRKPLLFVSSLVSGLGMCVLASWFVARQYGVYAPGWIPITSLCICIFCDSTGLQPISVVVMNEIFAFKYRSTVSALTMATASTSDFFQLLLFKMMANTIGIHYCFYFFGVICLVSAVYILLVVPETKMRRTEQIYEDLKTKKEKEAEFKNLKPINS